MWNHWLISLVHKLQSIFHKCLNSAEAGCNRFAFTSQGWKYISSWSISPSSYFYWWTKINVNCEANRCAQVPELQHAVPDNYLAVKGSVVRYTCIDGYISSNSSSLPIVCDGTVWTPAAPLGCKGTKSSTVFVSLRGTAETNNISTYMMKLSTAHTGTLLNET